MGSGGPRVRYEFAVNDHSESDDGPVIRDECLPDGSNLLQPIPGTVTAGSLSIPHAVPTACTSVPTRDTSKAVCAATADDFVAASVVGRAPDPTEPVGYETEPEPFPSGHHAFQEVSLLQGRGRG